jgi:hypothetical protein
VVGLNALLPVDRQSGEVLTNPKTAKRCAPARHVCTFEQMVSPLQHFRNGMLYVIENTGNCRKVFRCETRNSSAEAGVLLRFAGRYCEFFLSQINDGSEFAFA